MSPAENADSLGPFKPAEIAVVVLQAGLPDDLTTEEVLDRIFRDPAAKHGLSGDFSKRISPITR